MPAGLGGHLGITADGAARVRPNVKTWEYARTALRYWAFIVAATMAAAGAAYYVSSNTAPTYSASLRVIVGPNADVSDRSGVAESLTALDRQGVVKSLVEVLSSRDVMSRAAAQAGVRAGDGGAYTSRAAKVPDANVVQVWVDGPDAGKVTALAVRTANVGIDYFENLYKLYRAEVLEQPAPAEKIAPQPSRDAFVAGVLAAGLAALGGLAFDRVRSGGRAAPVETATDDDGPIPIGGSTPNHQPVAVDGGSGNHRPVPVDRASGNHRPVPVAAPAGEAALPRRRPRR
jgi:capsular polysaccharide biosynthesis protein